MPYYSSILSSVFVNGAPRALIAKTKSNHMQQREARLLEGPKFQPHVYVPMGGSTTIKFKATSKFKYVKENEPFQ